MLNGENFYLSSSSKKPKSLAKLKGIVVESVGWDMQNTSEGTTRDVLIGSSSGLIFEFSVDGTKERLRQVYNLNENTPVTGVKWERFPSASAAADPKFFVMATTAMRYYQFIGGPTFEACFAAYTVNPGFTELPGELSYSELHFFAEHFTGRSKSFAWLAGPGIYHGQLLFGSQNAGDSVITNATLCPYQPVDEGSAPRAPLSIAVTEFHFLLAYSDCLMAVSKLSDERVFEWRPPQKFAGNLRGLARDQQRKALWLYSDTSVFEIAVTDEDRNVWRLYLEKGSFEMALQHCKLSSQRDRVQTAQADYFFGNGQYELAACFYAKSSRQFEEVALRFVGIGERDALKSFLVHKMDNLRKVDATQLTCIASWLTEIYLDKLNALKDTEGDAEADGQYERLLEDFRQFLADNTDNLNPATTFNLISSHGRVEELLFYANLVEDHELVISHHIQCGEYLMALSVLAKLTGRNDDVYYKFSPVLMHHAPEQTVNAWMAAPFLDPKRLLPALMRYDEASDTSGTNQAIRYLESVIRRTKNQDAAIHNYLLSLYAKQPSDGPLLAFLHGGMGETSIDLKYALRLCARHGKMAACVHIYSQMGLFEEAVDLALKVDIELAKANADRPDPEDLELRKKLWLRIARHVVEEEKDIAKAINFLSCTSLLRIEDILPFFPDFVLIQDFKDEICHALEEYNENIESLKVEMEEATASADLIRQDIKELRNRYGYVKQAQRCDLCGVNVLSRAFYLFPCQHAFHADCLRDEVLRGATITQRAQVKDLESRLADLARAGAGAADHQQLHYQRGGSMGIIAGPSDDLVATATLRGNQKEDDKDKEAFFSLHHSKADELRAELDEVVASECVFCGEAMLRTIDQPFITAADKSIVESWVCE
jgi:tetratricopeptide (TPR) repeat protein